MARAIGVGAENAQAADERRHLRRGQRQELRPVDERLLGRRTAPSAKTSCGSRRPPARSPRRRRRRSAPASHRCGPGVNGTSTGVPAFFAAFSIAGGAAENDQVSERDLLAAGRRGVELLLDRLPACRSPWRAVAGWLTAQVLLRREPNARAVGTAALVGAAEGRGRGPGGRDEFGHGQARRRGSSPSARRRPRRRSAAWSSGRHRVLPDQLLLGTSGPR